MQRRTFIACLGAVGTFRVVPDFALAHGYKRGAIEIIHPWCPDTHVEGTKDVIVGMDIKSTVARGDKLLRAESKIASSVEIRDPTGVPVSSLAIPGKTTVTLGRKGAHIRLVVLKKTLIAYDTLPITLVFERGGRIAVDVLVEEPIEAKP
jgi:hypothetical protein